jgi:hypothetical protein
MPLSYHRWAADPSTAPARCASGRAATRQRSPTRRGLHALAALNPPASRQPYCLLAFAGGRPPRCLRARQVAAPTATLHRPYRLRLPHLARRYDTSLGQMAHAELDAPMSHWETALFERGRVTRTQVRFHFRRRVFGGGGACG